MNTHFRRARKPLKRKLSFSPKKLPGALADSANLQQKQEPSPSETGYTEKT